VIEPQFEVAADFYDGLARIEVQDLWGFIDKSGEFVIQPQFRSAGDFSAGLAFVIPTS